MRRRSRVRILAGGGRDAGRGPAPSGHDRTVDAGRVEPLASGVLGGSAVLATSSVSAVHDGIPPESPGSGAGTDTGPLVRAASVHVTVPVGTALGVEHEPGELAGYGPVPASMARRLAEGARWRKVSTDPATGAVVEIGRTAYLPSAALADLIRTRDRTCRFPGCRQPAARCDLDHVVPWPAGPTTAENLAVLCRHHHRLRHQAPWTVHAGLAGDPLRTSPAGQRSDHGGPGERAAPPARLTSDTGPTARACTRTARRVDRRPG